MLWLHLDFGPLEVCLAMFTQKKIYQQLLLSSGCSYFSSLLRCRWLCFVQKICQQLLPSSGSSYFLSLLRCCWLKRSVSKLLPSSATCSLCFISKITTSFTFAFTCFYFHITFKAPFPALSGHSHFGPLPKLLNNIFQVVTFGHRPTI